MQNIERDSRHSQVSIEFEGPIQARSFGDWSMGFLLHDQPKQDSLPGFADVLHNGMASARPDRSENARIGADAGDASPC